MHIIGKRVVVKINFNAATIKTIHGWKKKSKKRAAMQEVSSHTKQIIHRTQNSTMPNSNTPESTTSISNSHIEDKITNEVETYFAFRHIALDMEYSKYMENAGQYFDYSLRSYEDHEESGEYY